MFSIFHKKGRDLNLLRKTKYWSDIGKLVDTEDETRRKLCNYTYETVIREVINELDRTLGVMNRTPEGVLSHLGERINLFESFLEKDSDEQNSQKKSS